MWNHFKTKTTDGTGKNIEKGHLAAENGKIKVFEKPALLSNASLGGPAWNPIQTNFTKKCETWKYIFKRKSKIESKPAFIVYIIKQMISRIDKISVDLSHICCYRCYCCFVVVLLLLCCCVVVLLCCCCCCCCVVVLLCCWQVLMLVLFLFSSLIFVE